MPEFQFKGQGDSAQPRAWEARLVDSPGAFDDPRGYIAEDPGLIAAVQSALTLGMPLLVTGAPGVGKTQLAARIAFELDCGDPIVIPVKSSTEGLDFFFRIDHIERLHAANFVRATAPDVDTRSESSLGEPPDVALRADGSIARTDALDVRHFVEFGGLGLAILRTYPLAQLEALGLHTHAWTEAERKAGRARPRPSVVLVDEIDKAPPDVPNDLLEEIRRLEFSVPGLGEFSVPKEDPRVRPIVVITSNSEKALPDAFLRRCIYYDIPAPSAEMVQRIVESRLAERVALASGAGALSGPRFPQALKTYSLRFFHWLNDESAVRDLEKRPSTAELLAWFVSMERAGLTDADVPADKPASERWQQVARSALFKKEEDQARLSALVREFPRHAST